MRFFMYSCVLAAWALHFPACALTGAGARGCVHRTGECFDVTINGVEIVAPKSKLLLEEHERIARKPRDQANIHAINWEVSRPISGKLQIEAKPNQLGQSWFGSNFGVEYDVTPLTPGIELKYDSFLSSSAPGDSEGAAVFDRRLAQEILPAGNYLMRIDANGTENWDRKYILLRVKE